MVQACAMLVGLFCRKSSWCQTGKDAVTQRDYRVTRVLTNHCRLRRSVCQSINLRQHVIPVKLPRKVFPAALRNQSEPDLELLFNRLAFGVQIVPVEIRGALVLHVDEESSIWPQHVVRFFEELIDVHDVV